MTRRTKDSQPRTDPAAPSLRSSEIRYRRLFEAARDGILILDPDSRKIIDANPFITDLLGYSKKQLINKELWELGFHEDAGASRLAFQELEETGFIRYENLPLETKKGQRRQVEFVSNLYVEDGHRVIQCNVRDITERSREREALQASEERFRALFTLEPIGVYSCDAEGRLLDFNKRAEKLWGRKPKLRNMGERFCGSFKMFRLDGTSLPHKDCPMSQVLSGKIPVANDIEAVIERPDGTRIAVVVNIVPLRDSAGAISGAINCFYDVSRVREAENRLAQLARNLEITVAERTATLVTSNKRLGYALYCNQKSKNKYQKLFSESEGIQKQLRHLSRQVLTAQEEERKEISRDLHDEVVQTLTGISIELAALKGGPEFDAPSMRRKIARAQRLVASSASAVHRFARELRPAALDDLGLIPALNAYNRRLAKKKKIKIRLTEFGGIEALESEKQTVLYRVAQEALTNVVRHAKATEVRMSVRRLASSIQMEITDDGKSFDVNKILLARNNRRLGLIGMKERIEMVGGNLTIESSPGNGTTVRTQIPLNGSKSAKSGGEATGAGAQSSVGLQFRKLNGAAV
jgi:PAS domain S-box-containing protein